MENTNPSIAEGRHTRFMLQSEGARHRIVRWLIGCFAWLSICGAASIRLRAESERPAETDQELISALPANARLETGENGRRSVLIPRPGTPGSDDDTSSLSPYAKAVLDTIKVAEIAKRSPVVKELLLTQGNSLEKILLNGHSIYTEFGSRLAKAKHSIDMAFYKWDEDSNCAQLLGDGIRKLAQSPGEPVLVRMMVSDSTLPLSGRSINNLYNSVKKWAIPGSRVRFQLATYPYKALGSLHEKIIVIDGSTLLLTGANPEKQHDHPLKSWHDTGYVITGGAGLAAQSSFDESWMNHAKHWVCKPRSFQHDCQGEAHPITPRPWLRDQDYLPGDIPIIAVGRTAWGGLNSDVNNPQDQAWITLMDLAKTHIHIISPNINSKHFRSRVIDAVRRGVIVQLIVSRKFNDVTVDFAGGTNGEAIDDLLGQLASMNSEVKARLQIRWYSPDGHVPTEGNGDRASHVKYFSVDDQVAVIGSGNMDQQTWHHSREFNLLIDSREETKRLEEQIFLPDFQKSIPATSGR